MNKIKFTEKELNELFTGLANVMLAYENNHFKIGTAETSGEELVVLSDVVMPMNNFKALLNIWGRVRDNYIDDRIVDEIKTEEL